MKTKNLHTDQRIVRGAVAVILLMVLTFSFIFNPSTYHLIDCYFNNLTGHPCPSCGLTRSFHAMAHLQIIEAFGLNWMGPILFVVISITGTLLLFTAVSGKAFYFPNQPKVLKLSFIIMIVVWMIIWVARLIAGF